MHLFVAWTASPCIWRYIMLQNTYTMHPFAQHHLTRKPEISVTNTVRIFYQTTALLCFTAYFLLPHANKTWCQVHIEVWLSPFLMNDYLKKPYWGTEGRALLILNWWMAMISLTTLPSHRQGIYHIVHWTIRRVDPGASLHVLQKTKFLSLSGIPSLQRQDSFINQP